MMSAYPGTGYLEEVGVDAGRQLAGLGQPSEEVHRLALVRKSDVSQLNRHPRSVQLRAACVEQHITGSRNRRVFRK